MNKLRATLLATTAAAALGVAAIPAGAADMAAKAPYYAPPPPPAFSWSGCYVGAHTGFGWSQFSTGQAFLPDGDPTSFNSGMHSTADGTIFGGQVGCDAQFWGAWVFGVEAEYSGAAMNGFADFDGQCCFQHFKTDSFYSVTGRIGWAGWDPRTLLYVKGGWAGSRDEYMFSYADSAHQNRSGWTVGGGIAWAPVWAPNVEFFVEYDYYGLGTKRSAVCYGGSDCSQVDISHNINAVKVGANYKFNSFFGR
jgi:outer membrane immunogenic protein